jgi:hypothetical protein
MKVLAQRIVFSLLSICLTLTACDTVKPYLDADHTVHSMQFWDQYIQSDTQINVIIDQTLPSEIECLTDDDCPPLAYCRYDFQTQIIDLAIKWPSPDAANDTDPHLSSLKKSATCQPVLDLNSLSPNSLSPNSLSPNSLSPNSVQSNPPFAVYADQFQLLPQRPIYETWTANERCSSYHRKNHHYHGLLKKNQVIDDWICADDFEDQDGDALFDALWLGGTDLGRAVAGQDAFLPEGRLLIWRDQNQSYFALIILDVFAIDRFTQIDFSKAIARRTGLLVDHIFWHATGNLNAPDLTGLFGPTLEQTEFAFSDQQVKDADLKLISSLPIMSGRDEMLSLFILDQITQKIEHLINNPHLLKPAQLKIQMIENPFSFELPIFSMRAGLGFAIPDNNDDADYNDLEDFHYFYDAKKLFFERKSFPYVIDPSLRIMQWIELPEPSHTQPSDLSTDMQNMQDMQSDQSDQSDQVEINATSQDQIIATIFSMGFRDPPHEKDYLSSGVIGQTRALIELATSAPAMFMTFSSSDDIQFSQKVPNLKADGSLVGTIYDLSPTPDQSFAEGLSSIILQALKNNNRFQKDPVLIQPNPILETRPIWLPISNPRFALAFALNQQNSPQTTEQFNQFIKKDEQNQIYLLHELHLISWTNTNDMGENQSPLNWFFMPANLDSAMISGQGLSLKLSPKLRTYEDIDGDSILDDVDLEVQYETTLNQVEITKKLNLSNPQNFPILDPLNQPENWLISHVNGGFGTMYLKKSTIDIFEGKDQALIEIMQNLSRQYQDLIDIFVPFNRFSTTQKNQSQWFLLNPTEGLDALSQTAKDWINLKNHHELLIDHHQLKRIEVRQNDQLSEELIDQIEERLKTALDHTNLSSLTLSTDSWQIIRKYEDMEEILFRGRDELVIDQVDGQLKIYSLLSNFYEKRIDVSNTYLRFEYGNQPILIFEIPVIAHGKMVLSKHPNPLRTWDSPFYQSGALVYSILCDWIYLTDCLALDDQY